jgi:hypothetical protein
MSRTRAVKRSGPPAREQAWQTHTVGAALRALLQQVEIRIGLLPRADTFDRGNRFQGAVLLPANRAAPAELRAVFPEELAELQRLGKSVERCHATKLGACRVYCLPYYFFDGFNALLALERNGKPIAAWKDSEAFQAVSPQALAARVDYTTLEGFLLDALGRPA